jgi:tRNA(Glu) U13 pseudouridine synthase TruD
MKLVDPSGNEVTSKENKDAKELEKQLSSKIEEMLEPVMNKVKLSGAQVPQQQLMQISSAAHQMLFNRMIYNLLSKVGIEDINEVLSEDDVEELSTSLKNQIKIQGQDDDSNDIADMQEMMRQQQDKPEA